MWPIASCCVVASEELRQGTAWYKALLCATAGLPTRYPGIGVAEAGSFQVHTLAGLVNLTQLLNTPANTREVAMLTRTLLASHFLPFCV